MTEEIEVNKQIAEQAQKASPSTSNNDKTLVDSIRLLTGAWKLILGVTVVCTVAAVIYSLLSPDVYKAELLAYAPSTLFFLTSGTLSVNGWPTMKSRNLLLFRSLAPARLCFARPWTG